MSNTDTKEDWRTFECEECGAVEDLDMLFNPNLTEVPCVCTDCTGVMVRID